MLAYGGRREEFFRVRASVVLEPPLMYYLCSMFSLLFDGVQMGVIREALVERVQPDVAAAVKEAIDVSALLNYCTFSVFESLFSSW